MKMNISLDPFVLRCKDWKQVECDGLHLQFQHMGGRLGAWKFKFIHKLRSEGTYILETTILLIGDYSQQFTLHVISVMMGSYSFAIQLSFDLKVQILGSRAKSAFLNEIHSTPWPFKTSRQYKNCCQCLGQTYFWPKNLDLGFGLLEKISISVCVSPCGLKCIAACVQWYAPMALTTYNFLQHK